MKRTTYLTFLTIALSSVLLLVACTTRKTSDFGKEDWSHFILKETAEAWIKRYQVEARPYISAESNMFGKMKDTTSKNPYQALYFADYFPKGKWMMGHMMSKPNVVGFVVYYGIKDNGNIVPIIVGVDSKGNDVFWERPRSKTAAGVASVVEGVMDMGQKAPPPPMGNASANTMLP